MLCILEFDGASKGNPGKAGAGAVLRTEDGRVVDKLGIVFYSIVSYFKIRHLYIGSLISFPL